MACSHFGAKPFLKLILPYCLLMIPSESILSELWIKIEHLCLNRHVIHPSLKMAAILAQDHWLCYILATSWSWNANGMANTPLLFMAMEIIVSGAAKTADGIGMVYRNHRSTTSPVLCEAESVLSCKVWWNSSSGQGLSPRQQREEACHSKKG